MISKNCQLHIIEDRNSSLVKEFIDSVINHQTISSSLFDNPFGSQLKHFKWDIAVIWTKDSKPFYGWFLVQYPELPSNVMRCFVRMYSLEKPNFRFFREQWDMYENELSLMLFNKGIDTLFFTRHNTEKEQYKRWSPRWADWSPVPFKNIKFKNIEQTAVALSAFDPYNKPDTSFIKDLHLVP